MMQPDASALLAASTHTMANAMAAYEALGAKADCDDVLHAAVSAMLAKDVLYEPLSALCEHFPAWLAKARPLLSAVDYVARGRQYQAYQRLVLVYETEPGSYAKVASLMQAAAAFGPPPPELVEELGGGLKITADGRPLIPGQQTSGGM